MYHFTTAKVVCATAMIIQKFISFSAVQIYDLSYIHLHLITKSAKQTQALFAEARIDIIKSAVLPRLRETVRSPIPTLMRSRHFVESSEEEVFDGFISTFCQLFRQFCQSKQEQLNQLHGHSFVHRIFCLLTFSFSNPYVALCMTSKTKLCHPTYWNFSQTPKISIDMVLAHRHRAISTSKERFQNDPVLIPVSIGAV